MSELRKLLSKWKLLLLVELGNRYALIHRMRTRFIPFSAIQDDLDKLIVHVENAKDVVRAVQLAEWAEKNMTRRLLEVSKKTANWVFFERHGRKARGLHRLLCWFGIHYWGIGYIPYTDVVECETCRTQKRVEKAA